MIFLFTLALTIATSPDVRPLPAIAKSVDSYARFPSAEVCRVNREVAERWKAGVFRQAWMLGYCEIKCGPTIQQCVQWQEVGGPPAQAMRDEYDEADYLVRVWSLAVGMRDNETPDDYERDLRRLIGARAFVLGVLPAPVPYWRVPREGR